MKTKISYSLLAAAMACGMAQGATAYTTPVGYETLANNAGFNFIGVRLQESVIAAGTLDSATSNSVTDAQVNLGALITGGKTYILEIQNGSGIIQEITSAGVGNSITTAADLTGLTFPVSYSLRPASTLASVFGNSAVGHKLDIGGGGVAGADQVWLWNGSGYNRYYFDAAGGPDFDQETWQNVDTNAVVNGNNVNMIYADGFIISSATGKDVVVSGAVKTGATELNVVTGFNFVGSVAPAGMDLNAAFGDTAAEVTASGLNIGGGGVAGADQLWLWNGSGFTKVYFDAAGGPDFDLETWQNVDTGAPVLASTSLPAGYIISAATPGNIRSGVPSTFSSL
jgi:hypothetical protein